MNLLRDSGAVAQGGNFTIRTIFQKKKKKIVEFILWGVYTNTTKFSKKKNMRGIVEYMLECLHLSFQRKKK